MKKKKGIVVALLLAMLIASFISVLALPSLRLENKIYLDKSLMNLGENITVSAFTNSKEISIEISNSDKTYTYLATKGDIAFIPSEKGAYDVRLINLTSKKIIDSSSFNVNPPEKSITTDKKNYTISEIVKISASGFEPNDKIIINGSFTNYVIINPGKENLFKPQLIGEYQARYYSNNILVGIQSFLVHDEYTESRSQYPAPIRYLLNLLGKVIGKEKNHEGGIAIKVRDAQGKRKDAVLQLFDAGNDLVLDPVENQEYDAVVKVNGIVDEIELNDVTYTSSFDMRIDEVPKHKIIQSLDSSINPDPDSRKISSSSIARSFAINPENVKFSSGVVTATASGTKLYKCKTWDFENQVCPESWDFVKNIVPGEKYTIDIGPNDPAYAETGVSSVNTLKPIYHPGETVDIVAAILDNHGYLKNDADILLTVTSPDGVIATYSNYLDALKLTHVSRGIFSAEYTDTQNTGTYQIRITANGVDIDSEFGTYFEVRNSYEYEIMRSTPMSIDPFQGPFSSGIRIESLNGIAIDQFTEVLPGNFEIIDSGGAQISGDGTSTYLTWDIASLTGEVNYVAQAPRISPDLYAIGQSFVTYNSTSRFYEARPWYLAIDPILDTQKGLFIYADTATDVPAQRNWTGTTIQGEQKTAANPGGAPYWQKFRCMKKYPQCILVSLQDDDSLDMQIYNTTEKAWNGLVTLDADLGFSYGRAFDVECEDASGRCLIAYEIETTNNNDFNYRTWDGTTLSAASTFTVPNGGSNEFLWIDLYPEKGTNNIGIGLQMDDGNPSPAYAGFWNGTQFKNFTTLTPDSGDRSDRKHFACGWEETADEFTCFYGYGTTSALNASTFNKTHWRNLGRVYATDGVINEIAACGSDPLNGGSASDHIGLVFCETNAYRDGGVWNGTNFSKATTRDTPDRDTSSECAGNKNDAVRALNNDCKIDRTKDKIMFVWTDSGADYSESGTYTISTKTWSFVNWASGAQVGSDTTADVRSTTLVPNPSVNEMAYIQLDNSNDVQCAYWDGMTFDSSNCGIIETSGTTNQYTFTTFDFNRFMLQPYILIIDPRNTEKNYNYSGIAYPSNTHMAFQGGNRSGLPPPAAFAPLQTAEVSSTNYNQLATLDGNDLRTTITTTDGSRVYQSFKFTITDSISDMVSLTFTHRGHATQEVAATQASAFNIYAYNFSGDNYVLQRTVAANPGDITTNSIISANFSNYVQNGVAWFLVMGQFATGSGGSARADLWTDYAALTVETIPTLKGFAKINATAVDDDNIALCRYNFYNTTYWSGWTQLNFTGTDYYINLSNTTLIPDGKYTLIVLCNDTLGNIRNTTMDVRINNEIPKVMLMLPANTTNLTSSNASFTWNASNSAGASFLCNLTLDNKINQTNIVVDSGKNVSKNITRIADGTHYWNVSCADPGGSYGYSLTWVFDIDTLPPTIALNYPIHNANLSNASLLFNYTPTDVHQIMNCTLILNNLVNQTNSTITSGVPNYFNLTLSNGYFNWSVNCTDSFGYTGNATKRNFTLDTFYPWINLTIPSESIFYNGTATLNYTAVDNMDKNLTCNLTINNIVVNASIPSGNNTPISINKTMADGLKFWNVTCWDDAKNINVSETRNFTLMGAPYVQLILPPDLGQRNGVRVNFTYNVGDGDGIFNCSLIINGQQNQTTNGGQITNFGNNSFIANFTSQGWYNWTVNCIDWMYSVGNATYFRLYIDKAPPAVRINGPANGTIFNEVIANLNFTTIDTASANMTCNVTIDDIIRVANLNAINNTPTITNANLQNGIHKWNVTCWDLSGNWNISNTWNFSTNKTFAVNVTVVADKTIYQQGELALINTTTRNESLMPLASNVTTDIIYTNSSPTNIVWWNTSWERRKAVYITNQHPGPLYGVTWVNVTGLSSYISNCENSTRIVELDPDKFGHVINKTVIDGDNSTYCLLAFRANVSASAVNELNYFVYYNNSLARFENIENFTSEKIYDFATGAGTINLAYELDSNDVPATNLNSETALLTADYTAMDTSDDSRFQSLDPGTGDYAAIKIIMKIDEIADQVNDLNFFFEGYPQGGTNNIRIYYWDIAFGTWQFLVQDNIAPGSDGTMNGSISSGFSSVINSTGHIVWLVQYAATNDPLNVDYVKLTVKYDGKINDSVSATEGSVQRFINRTMNNTGAAGKHNRDFDTTGKMTGNYSSVSGANSLGYRFGFGFDFFEIIADSFGPNVTLFAPTNGMTNRTMNVTFTFSAYDLATGITSCSLIINREINQTIAPVINNQMYNFTINDTSEGYYNWTINCTDGNGNTDFGKPNRVFTIDNTPPVVNNTWPDDITIANNTVTFNFTAKDNFAMTMLCNVSVDDGVYFKEVNAQNNTMTSTSINNIPNGLHWWNVTCFDNIKNHNTSIERNFSVVAMPLVILDNPANGSGTSNQDVVFYYNMSNNMLSNCSLIINDAINQTEIAANIPYQNFDGTNNFTINSMTLGVYNWTVNCTDINDFVGTYPKRELQVDTYAPWVILGTPANMSELFSKNVRFNFTAYDLISYALTCNISVNDTINVTNVAAQSGIETIVNSGGFNAGWYSWNVTCWDATGFSNSSETMDFNISSRVSVFLNSPANNSADMDGNADFVFTPQSVADFNLGWCDFYIDDTWLETKVSPVNDVKNNFSRTGLSEGNHTWFVNCTDNYGTAAKSEIWSLMVDFRNPWVMLSQPNGHSFTTSSVDFNWTAFDNVASSLLCNVSINGTRMAQGIVSPNNTITNTTINNIVDGTLPWNVSCLDTSGRLNTSATQTVIVQAPPAISLNSPAIGFRTRIVNASFFFTPTDNSHAIKNCSLILNDKINLTNSTITESSLNNITRLNLADNQYNWSINCSDYNNNIANSSTWVMYVDLWPPWINTTQPSEGEAFNTDDILFNWTARDMWGTNLWCNITIDTKLNQTAIAATSGQPTTYLLENMSLGRHNFTITCWDDLNWTNSTNISTFIVNAPDLRLNDSYIAFNNSQPDVNESIMINATIFNIGGYPAFDALIEFWNGLPGLGFFIGNATIQQLDPQKNITVNVTWNISEGMNNIWVVADPYDGLVELNDSNNNGTRNISVLVSRIIYPANASWTNNLTNPFNFTLAGFVDALIHYRVFVDGILNGQSGTVNDNTTSGIEITSVQGIRKVKIEANDSSGRFKNSSEITLYVDTSVPTIIFQTLNNTWFNRADPTISFIINDNLDSFLNYTLYLDGSANITSVANATSNWNNTLQNLINGTYHISISSYDNAGNMANTSNITIYIDTMPPSVVLDYPSNNDNFTNTNPELNFTAIDNMAPIISCNLTVDNNIIRSIAAPNNTVINTTVSGMSEGTHYWNVTCYDNATNANTSITRYFNSFQPPMINLSTPANNSWLELENVTFLFNVSDETGIENCSIILNGAINQTRWTENITNNGANNFTINYLNGTYNWSIQCFDNTTFNVKGSSKNWTLSVDIENPNPGIETSTGIWFGTSTPSIRYNITDNMAAVLSYIFFVDGILNKNGIVNNGVSAQTSLNIVSDGLHSLILQGSDTANNSKNTSSIIFGIDTSIPYINLNFPLDGNVSDNNSMTFNFTAIDATSANLTCNMTIDGAIVARFNSTNNTPSAISLDNLEFGFHYWNVSCLDFALNLNTSETRNFSIPAPDVMINATDIIFNNTNPKEGENVTINATIYNVGKSTARNFTAQFWDGNWTDGLWIGNISINNITSSGNLTIGVVWSARLGQHEIYVIIDAPLETNGTIKEVNETNNYASKTIGVVFWHFFSGNVSGTLRIGTQNDSVFSWILSDYNGSNIFAADTDNTLNWLNLKELGINSTNNTEFDDFAELDIQLNSTDFADSINKTFTTSNLPTMKRAFMIFGYNLTNVSVSNSTNTSQFLTGIVWDMTNATHYNGTQDIAFVTESNTGLGSQGYYDYEIRVPATLRSYKGTTNTVSFYTELK